MDKKWNFGSVCYSNKQNTNFSAGGPHRLAVLRSEFPKALQSREFQLANIQTSSSPCQMSICQEIWSLGGSHTVKNHVATITKNLQPISDTFTLMSKVPYCGTKWSHYKIDLPLAIPKKSLLNVRTPGDLNFLNQEFPLVTVCICIVDPQKSKI